MSKRFLFITAIATLFGIMLACTPEVRESSPPESTEFIDEPKPKKRSWFSKPPKLELNGLQVLLYESFPVEIEAAVRGFVGDSCLKLTHTLPDQQGKAFIVKLATKQDERFPCTGRQKAFNIRIHIPIDGLTAGTYQVKVNDLEAEFDLLVDNIIRY